MPGRDPLKDLELLIRSRYAILVLETAEEERAESLLRHLADQLRLPLFVWTPTKGLRRDGTPGAVYRTLEPLGALDHIEHARIAALYNFQGIGPLLNEPVRGARLAVKLKDAAAQFAERTGAMVLTGVDVVLPESLRSISAAVSLPVPTRQEYQDLFLRIARDLETRASVKVELSGPDLTRLLNNLQGLTLLEAEKVLTKAMIEDSRLSADDIGRVIEAKKQIIEREGLLEYYPLEQEVHEIADLQALKDWLGKRRAFITEPERAAEYGLSFPKGILLVGVPGCGKSLCARAVAMEWGLPLLRLDPGNLYNKYLGESEKNFQRAIRAAERMAPVILWIDELEKAFAAAGDSADGGVSTRILGSFLTWLQDRKGDVFVVATANDVSRLPPEFIRKGRFDEIFFLDLPTPEVRAALFRIHLARRGQDPQRFDLGALVNAAGGFSGAEIEQAIVSGLYTAFAGGTQLSTAALLDEISRTRPLARTMAERIQALRHWARDRTVSAQ